MAAVVVTNIAAGSFIDSAGYAHNLYTGTATSGGTVDLSTVFENIYFSKAWKTADGVDVEIFCDTAYANTMTFHTTTGACYLYVIGKPIRSTGGST